MTTHSQDSEREIERWTARLLTQGYCVIEDLLPKGWIEVLDRDLEPDFAETPFCQGGFYGARTKRFGRLLARSPISARIVQHPLVLGIVRQVLSPWCDTIQLNLTQALALHPGAPPQLPHRDQDMWRGGIGETEYLVNVMWPFTRYTRENGATIVWPKSHGLRALDPEPSEGEFAVELEPGSALLFLGSTLHGAGGNVSTEVRRGAIVSGVLTPRRLRQRMSDVNHLIAHVKGLRLNSRPSNRRNHRPIERVVRRTGIWFRGMNPTGWSGPSR